jgi:hypothetical protein
MESFLFVVLGITLASSLLLMPFYWKKAGILLIIIYALCILITLLTKGYVEGFIMSSVTGYAGLLGIYLTGNANFFKDKNKAYVLVLAVVSPLFALYAILYSGASYIGCLIVNFAVTTLAIVLKLVHDKNTKVG